MKKKSNAGRKKDPNKKMTVALMIPKGDIVGYDNLDMEPKDEQGVWNPDYLDALEVFKKDVMEFINKRKEN